MSRQHSFAMHSFILITKNDEKRNAYIKTFSKEKGIEKIDIHIFQPEENSFGIADVRNIQKTALLKPQQSKEKMLLLNSAQLLTKEAQNALLKLLEEPPLHTYIFLSATTSAFFLSTIMSRCKEVILDENILITKEQTDTLSEHARIIQNGSLTQKLALAEKIAADKENLSGWFEKILLIVREKMLEEPENPIYVLVIRQIQNAQTLFQATNVSPRMILEHCFLTV